MHCVPPLLSSQGKQAVIGVGAEYLSTLVAVPGLGADKHDISEDS